MRSNVNRSRSRNAAFSILAAALMTGAMSLPVAAQSTQATTDADNGTVWWNELVASDPDRSRDFYQTVAGWTPKIVAADDNTRAPAPGEPAYTLFSAGSTEAAGMTKYEGKDASDPKPGWLMYIQVADVDTAVGEALKKGGKILRAPADATKIGRIAIVQDPDGNAFGLFSPVKTTAPTQ